MTNNNDIKNEINNFLFLLLSEISFSIFIGDLIINLGFLNSTFNI